jgi:hypothetical protein
MIVIFKVPVEDANLITMITYIKRDLFQLYLDNSKKSKNNQQDWQQMLLPK